MRDGVQGYGPEGWEGKGPMSFGDNLERLDEVLRRLESEPIPLDEALEVFEHSKVCGGSKERPKGGLEIL